MPISRVKRWRPRPQAVDERASVRGLRAVAMFEALKGIDPSRHYETVFRKATEVIDDSFSEVNFWVVRRPCPDVGPQYRSAIFYSDPGAAGTPAEFRCGVVHGEQANVVCNECGTVVRTGPG